MSEAIKSFLKWCLYSTFLVWIAPLQNLIVFYSPHEWNPCKILLTIISFFYNMCFENEITSIIMLSIECCSCILEGRNWIHKRLPEVELVVAFCSCPKSICNRYHFHKFIFLMLVCTSFRSFSFCCKLPQRHGQSWEKTLKNIVTKYLRGALRLTSSFLPQFHLLR